ncbi:MAG: hypothetical protein CBHOC_1005 [uncultured Caballeronia sp.]|nr:MAG: hypothetical protein CBHOC_1005 [uncultured Caballeronia sp.]
MRLSRWRRDRDEHGRLLKLVKAVFWSFFGVCRRADLESDVAQLKPLHLIAAGIIGAVLFIVVLLLVVRAVVVG